MSEEELEPEQQVQQNRLLEELDREGELVQLRALLAQEPLRDFLWRLLEKCRVYSSVYQKNFGDMAFAEGQRNLGLWLLNEICAADPSAEIAMKQKANQLAFQQKLSEAHKRRRAPTP